jgi:hypothetical protein
MLSLCERLMHMPLAPGHSLVVYESPLARRHDPITLSFHKPHLQGAWGRAAPSVGSARGKAHSHPRLSNSGVWGAAPRKRKLTLCGGTLDKMPRKEYTHFDVNVKVG